MKLEPISDEDARGFMNMTSAGRPSVSKPLLQGFLNSKDIAAKVVHDDGKSLDAADVKRLHTNISTYAKNREYPVAVVKSTTDLYFIKVHQTAEGKALYNYPLSEDPPENATTTKQIYKESTL